MAASPSDVLKLGQQSGAQFVDIRFCDLPGLMQHFSMPFDELGEEDRVGRHVREVLGKVRGPVVVTPDADTVHTHDGAGVLDVVGNLPQGGAGLWFEADELLPHSFPGFPVAGIVQAISHVLVET